MGDLEVHGLSKSFGDRQVLADVTFRAPKGDVVSVIGPSGCGKTTLFRCILGEIEPDGGRVTVGGEDITHLPVQKRGVGIVYQSYALFPHLTVGQNVGYGLTSRGAPKERTRDRVREMLDLVHLADKEDRYPSGLSGGEKQRVALARALAVEPRVLLLDEAFAALDATTRGEVVHEVRNIVRRVGITTLLITHDQEEAFVFSRHVLVMNGGRVVTQGTPEEVMAYEDLFLKDFVKMLMITRSKVEDDGDGNPVVQVEGGQLIPIHLPNVQPGDEVHVLIKKGPKTESIEVWPYEHT